MFRHRKASRSRVDRSAQWRSSMTRRTGRSTARRPSRLQHPLEDPDLEPIDLRTCSPWPSRRRPASRAAARGRGGRGPAASGPRRPRWSRGRTSRASARSTSTIGPNGSASSPSATEPPSRTSQPSSRSRVAASVTSRLLPTPASPPTSTIDGRRVLGGPGGREERRELVGATDEHRAGQAAGHAADDR